MELHGAVLPAVCAPKMNYAADVIQITVLIKNGVITENALFQKDWHIALTVIRIAGKECLVKSSHMRLLCLRKDTVKRYCWIALRRTKRTVLFITEAEYDAEKLIAFIKTGKKK